jgi:hypothetical protein
MEEEYFLQVGLTLFLISQSDLPIGAQHCGGSALN